MYFSSFKQYLAILFLIAAVTCNTACSFKETTSPKKVGSNPDLLQHSNEFRKEVIKVTDGVYVAIGFGLANSILIEGNDGIIIVDTMECAESAQNIKTEFDKITSKPLKAIIYTHFHSDHTFGTNVFTEDKDIAIYSHENTLYFLDRIASITRETTYRRAMRQFGSLLPKESLINDGIGPRLIFDGTQSLALVRPNKTFSGESISLEIAGIKLELIHAPGETDDQIFVWLPEKKVLLPADNYYKSFPNLYAIRGTAYRDVMKWVKSLDKMRALKAEYLVPSHTRPLTGQDNIYNTLTNYRDAIQYVHDQTIRNINKGFLLEEIVEKVKLPEHLANLPYLHEYYGTVAWSVRAIFNGYLGWFGGNATDLFPLPPKQKAKCFAELAGGKDNLLIQIKQAYQNNNFQWVLVLADQVLQLDPQSAEAIAFKAKALTHLGESQITSTARNYYLTQALEVQGKLTINQMPVKDKSVVHGVPLKAIFDGMAVHLNPEKSAHINKIAGFRFPDTNEAYTVHIRYGVAEVRPSFPDNPDITITTDSFIWKELAAKMRNPALTLAKGDLKIDGGTLQFVKFINLFDID